MSEFLYNDELERIQRDQVEKAQAIGEIFDTAVESADIVRLKKITETYPRKYLDCILGGYPDYIDEILDEEGVI